MIAEHDLRQELLRYLTGAMTGEEHAIFETRLIEDQEFSDAVAASEQDLIDAYALGTLNPEEARSLQPWIEAAPKRIQRVLIARAFFARKPQIISSKQRIAILSTIAACLLIAIGITINRQHKLNSSRVPPPSATTTPAPASTPQPLGFKEPQVILLIAERIRGEQPITIFKLLPDAPIRLQILLVSEREQLTYTAKIISSDNHHVVWERKGLKAKQKDGQVFVEATLPPGSFPPATYYVLVNGGSGGLISHFTVRQ